MTPRINLPAKEELERLYHQEKMTMQQIGEQYGTTAPTILYWLRRHGIKTRGKQEATKLAFEQGRQVVRRGSVPRPIIVDGQMTCKSCGELKPLSEFRKRSDAHHGYSSVCKVCAVERGKQFKLRGAMFKRGLSRCSRCEQWLSIENFRKKGNGYNGIASACKRCSSNNSEYHDYLSEREALLSFGQKYCPKCDTVKPIEEFGTHAHTLDGLQGVCKHCKNRMTSVYYQKNHSEILEKSRLRRNTPEGKRRTRDYFKRAWDNNPEYYRERVRKRRKQIEHNGGEYSWQQWLWLLDYYCPERKCLACGEYTEMLTPDHVVPVSWGGTSFISNIQPICFSCNSRKAAKNDDDWRQDKGRHALWIRENIK